MQKDAKLILGGGAAYGLAHIGVLEALSSEFRITGIVGTSMGAIVGGLYALGKTPREILDIALESGSAAVFNPGWIPLKPQKLPLDLLSGLHNKKKIMELIGSMTAGARIEELPLPFVSVAYDLNQRKTILIDKGSLASAMRASSSLPLLFAPYAVGKYLFVDGGVEHPLPLAFGDSVPGAYTIAVNVLPPVSTEAETIELDSKGASPSLPSHQVVIQSILQNQGFVAIQELLQNPPDLFIDAHDSSKKILDIFDAQAFFDFGLAAANESLQKRSEPSFMEHMVSRYQDLVARLMKRKH